MPDLLSVEQVAERLGLHVRTVRRYVREGRLRARRIGKQYRIARTDYEAFTEGIADGASIDADRTLAIDASSIVTVEPIGREGADALLQALLAAAAARATGEEPMRVHTVYEPARRRLKIVALGGLAASAELFRTVEAGLRARADQSSPGRPLPAPSANR